MRPALLLGRQCLFQGLSQSCSTAQRCLRFRSFTSSNSSGHSSFPRRYFSKPRFPKGKILWSGAAGASAAALTPLGFIALGNHESENGGMTQEEAMLAASRKELKEQVPKALRNSRKIRRGIYFFLDVYIIEPIATGLRFLHLVLIFTPVLLTIPVIWLGKRQSDRDNERTGTLWWYGFLVRSMERAGAAFIKVGS